MQQLLLLRVVSLHLVETSLQTDAERAHLEHRENEEVEMIILSICLPNSFHFAMEELTQVFTKEMMFVINLLNLCPPNPPKNFDQTSERAVD